MQAGFPGGTSGQESSAMQKMQEARVGSLDQEDPLEEEMATHSSISPGKFHVQRSLAGYSSWGCRESDTTERLNVGTMLGANTAV